MQYNGHTSRNSMLGKKSGYRKREIQASEDLGSNFIWTGSEVNSR